MPKMRTKVQHLETQIQSGNKRFIRYAEGAAHYSLGLHTFSFDLSGMTFGKLQVIKRDETKSGVYWECRCECGSIISATTYVLRHGKTSCGCERERAMDISGLKFGRLTVKEKSEERASNGDVYWLCDCECGTKNILVTRSNLLSKTKYRTLSCGCYKNEGLHIVNREDDRKKHIIKYLYGKVRNRKIGFDNSKMISIEHYEKMIFEPCFYCGLIGGNTTYDTECYEGNYKNKEHFSKHRVSDEIVRHNGIDRIDSSVGYVPGNVVPCCKYCNMAKMDRTKEEFLKWAEETYQFFVLGNKNKNP